MDIEGIIAILCFFGTIIYIVDSISRRKKASAVPDPALFAALRQAEAQAARLEERIDHLERVLDEDAPGWRTRSPR